MIISCQTLLGRLDVRMVLSHPLRMLFVIFPVHKLHFNYTSFLLLS